ncbi:MAG: NAD(P)H-binding protein [Bacilli bacterium]|nr:NAD(P)H-binding protein [Bacilli bacterium]
MAKILLTGVDGNLGSLAAEYLLKLEDKKNLIFVAYSPASLEKYKAMGIDTRVADFNHYEGLEDAFKGADILGLISMPFVGPKRQNAQKNVVDAAIKAGVKKIVYTSLVNAGDETNPSVEKKDHIYTERYIQGTDLDYIFLRNSQYAEAMITNYFTFVHADGVLKNSQGDGLMAYISRKDCAKALAYALHRGDEPQYHKATLDINGKELMTISKFIEYGNQATGNHVSYKELTDEENYQVFDAMGVPRTTDGVFKEGSEAPFSSDGMVTFAQAIREGKMAVHTDDFKKLTGDDPITVLYMFEHNADFQIGDRHSKDK